MAYDERYLLKLGAMMKGITQINLNGFRRHFALDTSLAPFTVLVGPNNAGKSSLFEALSLMAASAQKRLSNQLAVSNGLHSMLTRGKSDCLSIQLDCQIDAYSFTYFLELTPQSGGYLIRRERLERTPSKLQLIHAVNPSVQYFDLSGSAWISPTWNYNPTETALSQCGHGFPEADYFREQLTKISVYRPLDLGRLAPVKLPQSLRPVRLPGLGGEDLVPYLYNLRETENDRFEDILQILRLAFPEFEGLTFPAVANGMITLTWRDKNFSQPLYINELSEGTLRFLFLIALLHSPAPDLVTLIDEPETSLHPRLMHLLVESMRKASADTQIIVATQSDRLLHFLEPQELVILDTDDEGHAIATQAKDMDLGKWLEEYTLDELWRMGHLGGVR